MPNSTSPLPPSFMQRHAFTLAAIFLPVLIAGLFLLASALPHYFVEDPEYELLFTVETPHAAAQNYKLQFNVRDNRIEVIANPLDQPKTFSEQRLYKFTPSTQQLEQVELNVPAGFETRVVVALPQHIQNLEVLSGTTAPDGYVFRPDHHHNTGLFGGLFGGGSKISLGSISRSGRVIAIQPADQVRYRYYYRTVQVLGWSKP